MKSKNIDSKKSFYRVFKN